MMKQYSEDDMLMLSGIQHYAFCPRQWALIHINQQWEDNHLTAEGTIMHQHVDNPFYRQKMGEVICLRSVNIASKSLGLYGFSDVIELHHSELSENTIVHPKYPGYWSPYPIEYKHGRPKQSNIDAVQLCAQTMCIEEQYDINITKGAVFYEQTRRREEISFSNELRAEVRMYAAAMHELFESGIVPHAEKKFQCKSCSLKGICMPDTAFPHSASAYLKLNLYEETT